MPQLTLLAPTPHDLSAFGVRSISAYLRRKGVSTRIVFFPGSLGLLTEGGEFSYSFSEHIVEQAVSLCQGSDLVGVSFFTNYFDRAAQLTAAVKKAGLPVVWGGIHAVCKPREALEYADFVCVGEGESALFELLGALRAGQGENDIEGVWTKTRENGLRPLIKDLDSLPYFDFSCEEHYLYAPEKNAVVPLDDAALMRCLPRVPYFSHSLLTVYRTMTDRGCPHRCEYCNVPTVKALFAGSGTPYFRNRGVEHVMGELEWTMKRFPEIQGVQFFDDTFFSRPVSWMREFGAAYKERIAKPFYCQASPTTLTREKLDILLEAGLVYVEMGVQTGSPKIRKIFNRPENDEQILEGARLVREYVPKKLLPPDYHVIIDSPWETPEDLLYTVRLVAKIPKPFGLAIASLIFFPETGLYRRAKAEGLIHDETTEIYRKPFYIPPQKTYPAFLLYLLTFQHFPRPLFNLLISDAAVRFFRKTEPRLLYKLGYVLGEASRLFAKGLFALARGDFSRIAGFFKRLLLRDPVVAGRKGA
jgi:anaerobic magnesium-protoporphyrin IX monomethyl ester cyclase